MYTLVGAVANTHGIKGGLKIYPFTYDNNRFLEYEKVFIGEDKEEVHIKTVSFHKNLVILTFEEYDNINDVLKFKDKELFIKSEDKKELDEDSYYIGDILFAKVFDKNNNYLGTVTEIIQGAKNDVYVIKSEKKEGMVPAVKEFVKKVDLNNNRIIIDPIEGMFNEI